MHATAYIRVHVCVVLFASVFACVCALMIYFISISPMSPPALIPGHLPQIPIGDGSTLEFIPHHPAEL